MYEKQTRKVECRGKKPCYENDSKVFCEMFSIYVKCVALVMI
ncbi:hypothetical protein WYY_09969 [Bacillus velezensis M27]|nr:hypothetical protein WYY_09969 [Bacillus velezensis M27]RAP19624.1 hypothetical protein C2W63_01349 [Bacillus velezensis]GFR56832.1 hypothetical protein WYY_09969 [Bacillus sp. CN2]